MSSVVRERPNDVDARLRLGLALAASKQWTPAEREFRQVIAQAPTYWDAHIALARVAYWRGDLEEAERRLAPVRAASPEPVEAATLRERIAAARSGGRRSWRVDLSASHSDLSKGLKPWRELNATVSRPVDGSQGYLAGSIQAAERFGQRDVYVEGLYGRGFGSEGEAYLAIGGTPNAHFRPTAQVRAGATTAIGGAGLSAGVHLALARFPTEESASLRGVLRQSLLDDRLAVSGSLIHVWTDSGRSLTGYGVQVEAAVTRDARLLVGYSDAPESSDGVATDVKSVSAGLRYDLAPTKAIGLTYVHEDRGAYLRKELALSTTLRF